MPGRNADPTAGHPTEHRRRLLLHIRHFGVGGIENALMGWVRGLDRGLFAVDVSVALPTRELDEIYRARMPRDVAVHSLIPADSWLARMHQRRRDGNLGKMGRLAFGLVMAVAGQARIRQGIRSLARDYDVVIDYDLTLRKAAPAIDPPLIGVRHFRFWHRRTHKAARVGRAYRHYDCIVVLNEAMREQAQALFAGEIRHVATLPNAFDLAAIRRRAAEAIAQPLPDRPYAVCVARVDIATKGLDVLLRAWRRMLDDAAQAELAVSTLVMVGDGGDREALEHMVRELGLERNVEFAGLQINPYPWIRQARFLVLASRTEGLPNVLIEAMALDCPVVSTDCPVGPREILADGRAGLLVPVDDVAGLARAMRQAQSAPAWRAATLAAARRQAEEYDIAAGNRRMHALIEKVLSGH